MKKSKLMSYSTFSLAPVTVMQDDFVSKVDLIETKISRTAEFINKKKKIYIYIYMYIYYIYYIYII